VAGSCCRHGGARQESGRPGARTPRRCICRHGSSRIYKAANAVMEGIAAPVYGTETPDEEGGSEDPK
jgi:hypothetical protein